MRVILGTFKIDVLLIVNIFSGKTSLAHKEASPTSLIIFVNIFPKGHSNKKKNYELGRFLKC